MDDKTNLISTMTTYQTVDDCDSREINHLLPKQCKIHVHEEKACNYGSRFKGIVGQHSGYCSKGNFKFLYMQLFQKKLTPSDVGNLYRLVIPKKYATKYFPQIQGEEMSFYDTAGRLWKFKYCYCKSSQKFVFTKGWHQFVKDKGLRAKDTIIFFCEFKNGINENCNTFVIDVVKNVEVFPMELELNHHQQEKETIDDHEVETKAFMRPQPFDYDAAATTLVPVRVFGKQIGWTETKKEYGV